MGTKPILIVTDLSDAADTIVRFAVAHARRGGHRLVVFHPLPESRHGDMLFPHLESVQPLASATFAEAALAAVQDRIGRLTDASGVACDVRVVVGPPLPQLLEFATAHAPELFALSPGTLALELARSRVAPVAVVRPAPANGPVVGASDFSDAALPALRAAARWASETGVPLAALHCVDIEPMAAVSGAGVAGTGGLDVMPDVMHATAEDARARLASAMAAAGTTGTAIVTIAPAGPGIVELARSDGASLVVVGTHGRSGFSRLLMGSVAEYVATHAPCSVLMVPLTDVQS